jgi:molecular chaperone DnaK (HSP70)
VAKIVGIDLGTTNSVIALVDKGVQLRQNKEQDYLTPSVVAYRSIQGKDVFTVGRQAKNIRKIAPDQYINSIKRLMGRGFQDEEVGRVSARYAYKIVQPSHGTAEGVAVVLGGKEFTPEDISAMILGKVKGDVEQSVGDKITHAVITVPAYFSEKQKMATYSAAVKAGLTVLHLVPEPTAAAIAYGLQQMDESAMPKMVLVYDLGGGTFDLTLLMMTQGVYSPLNNGGDMWLGGDDFDNVISNRVIDHVRGKYGKDQARDPSFMAELAEEARKAKEELCGTDVPEVEVFFTVKDGRGQVTESIFVTREQFESDITPLADRIDVLIDDLFKAAGAKRSDVSIVLQIGNGSLIPLLQRRLDVQFPGKVDRRMQAKHCVAMGAAMLAATLRGMICPRDGALNDLGAKQCKECKLPFEAKSVCPHCGHDCAPGDQCCPACGKPISQPPDKIAPLYYGIPVAGGFKPFINRGEPISIARGRPPQLVHPPFDGARMVSLSVFGRENLDGTGKNEKQCEAFAVLPQGLSVNTGIRLKIWLNENELFELGAVLENGVDLKPRVVRGGDPFQKAIRDFEEFENNAAKPDMALTDPKKGHQLRQALFDHLAGGRTEEASALILQLMQLLKPIDISLTREQWVNFLLFLCGANIWTLAGRQFDRLMSAAIALVQAFHDHANDETFQTTVQHVFDSLAGESEEYKQWQYDQMCLRELASEDSAEAGQLQGEIQHLAGETIGPLLQGATGVQPDRQAWRSLMLSVERAIAKHPNLVIRCPKCKRPVTRSTIGLYCPYQDCKADLRIPH